MRFCETDQRLEHTDGLSILTESASVSQVGEISLQYHFGLLTANWIYISLDIDYVLREFVGIPQFGISLLIVLLSRNGQFEVCLGFVDLCILLVYHDKH